MRQHAYMHPIRFTIPKELIGQAIHPEGAASEVQNRAFFLEPASKRRSDKIFAALPHGAQAHDPGGFENPEMFGDIILTHLEALRQFIYTEIRREESFHDTLASTV